MRRLTTMAGLALALGAMTVLPVAAAPPTVGGPRGASMATSFTATGPQAHPIAETTQNNPVDPGVIATCVAPRCYAFPFKVVATKKGAKSAPVSAQIRWTLPTSRFWLSIRDVTKDPEIVANCFTFFTGAGPSATVRVNLLTSRKYAIWVTVQQVLGASEVVKGAVRAPAKDFAPASPISGADPTGLFLNPCQG